MHQFVNEARQVKMLSELQNIYPIHLVEKSGESEVWAIRSLELPKDFTTLDEEHISSALGYNHTDPHSHPYLMSPSPFSF